MGTGDGVGVGLRAGVPPLRFEIPNLDPLPSPKVAIYPPLAARRPSRDLGGPAFPIKSGSGIWVRVGFQSSDVTGRCPCLFEDFYLSGEKDHLSTFLFTWYFFAKYFSSGTRASLLPRLMYVKYYISFTLFDTAY